MPSILFTLSIDIEQSEKNEDEPLKLVDIIPIQKPASQEDEIALYQDLTDLVGELARISYEVLKMDVPIDSIQDEFHNQCTSSTNLLISSAPIQIATVLEQDNLRDLIHSLQTKDMNVFQKIKWYVSRVFSAKK